METFKKKNFLEKKTFRKSLNKKKTKLTNDIYHSSLSYTKKLTFITNFIYKNIKETQNCIYKIEEFESDEEEIIDEVTYDSSDFFSD